MEVIVGMASKVDSKPIEKHGAEVIKLILQVLILQLFKDYT